MEAAWLSIPVTVMDYAHAQTSRLNCRPYILNIAISESNLSALGDGSSLILYKAWYKVLIITSERPKYILCVVITSGTIAARSSWLQTASTDFPLKQR